MTGFLKAIVIIILITGSIICFMKMRYGSRVHIKGLIFFLLQLLANGYTLIIPYYIDGLIKNKSGNIGIMIARLNIPPLLLSVISFIILLSIFTKNKAEV